MSPNKGDIDLIRLVLLDPETGKEETVESDPMNRVDFGTARFSEVTDELIYTTYDDDKPQTYFKDKDFNPTTKFCNSSYRLGKSLSARPRKTKVYGWSRLERHGAGRNLSLRPEDEEADEAIQRSSETPARSPGGNARRPVQVLGRLGDSRVSDFAERCGPEKPAHDHHAARRTLGPGYVGYNSYAQFAANRGYAVLQPNFRASTGFGKKFLDAGNNQWGDKMQDDLTYGVKYLIAEGIADPKRVGIWAEATAATRRWRALPSHRSCTRRRLPKWRRRT